MTWSYVFGPSSLAVMPDPSPPTSDPCSPSPLAPGVVTTILELRPEIQKGLRGPTMGSCSTLLIFTACLTSISPRWILTSAVARGPY